MTDFPDAMPLGTVVAGYEIKRVLGQGGFGIAYEAWNPDLGEKAVIKEFFPRGLGVRSGTTFVTSQSQRPLYARLLDKFIDEARTVRRFDHPNIVKVRHLERANNTAYMVMDFVEGGTLTDWVREQGARLDAGLLRTTFTPIIEALAHVHASDKLHRDVSPMNILVDRTGRPVLIDFGAVKHGWQDEPAASSMLIAHPLYAPPEHLIREIDQTQGPTIDVYSLAAVMYETIAGERPPAAQVRQNALARRQPDPLKRLATMAKVPCPVAVTDVIDKALSFEAKDRPQSMEAFRAALQWGPADDRRRDGNITGAGTPEQPTQQAHTATAEPADSGWRRIVPTVVPPPNGLSGWIAGHPVSGASWWTPVLGVAAYLTGAAGNLTVFSRVLTSTDNWTISALLLFCASTVLFPIVVSLVLRPRSGRALILLWLLAVGMAFTPVGASTGSGWMPVSIAITFIVAASGAYMAWHRPRDETEFALIWMGCVLTCIPMGLVFFRNAGISDLAKFLAFFAAIALLAIVTIGWRRPGIATPALAIYMAMVLLPLIGAAVHAAAS